MDTVSIKEAVILAGGNGTRLYPLTQTRAKALLPLAGIPLIHRLVRYLEMNGFDTIVVTLNNFSNQIKQSLKDFDCLADLKFSEESTPFGTAGSVRNARRYIKNNFLVIQGDALTDFDLSAPKMFHFTHKEIATILLKRKKDVTGLGVIDLDDESNITRFVEKPKVSDERSRLVSTGTYILEPEVLDYIPENQPFDFARNLFPKLMHERLKIKGLEMDGYWIDIGTPKTYREACMWLFESVRKQPPAYSNGLGRIGMPGWTIEGTSMIGPECCIDKKVMIDGCILERGVTVVSDAVLRGSVILERSTIGSGATVESAIVGEDCDIGGGSRIGAGAVLGGAVQVMPNATVGQNSVIHAKSIIEQIPVQAPHASGNGSHRSKSEVIQLI